MLVRVSASMALFRACRMKLLPLPAIHASPITTGTHTPTPGSRVGMTCGCREVLQTFHELNCGSQSRASCPPVDRTADKIPKGGRLVVDLLQAVLEDHFDRIAEDPNADHGRGKRGVPSFQTGRVANALPRGVAHLGQQALPYHCVTLQTSNHCQYTFVHKSALRQRAGYDVPLPVLLLLSDRGCLTLWHAAYAAVCSRGAAQAADRTFSMAAHFDLIVIGGGSGNILFILISYECCAS